MSEKWDRELTPPTPSDDEFGTESVKSNNLKEKDGAPDTTSGEASPEFSNQDTATDDAAKNTTDGRLPVIPEEDMEGEAMNAAENEGDDIRIKQEEHSEDGLICSITLIEEPDVKAPSETSTEKPSELADDQSPDFENLHSVECNIEREGEDEGEGEGEGEDDEDGLKFVLSKVEHGDEMEQEDGRNIFEDQPLLRNQDYGMPSDIINGLQIGLSAAMESLKLDGSIHNEHVMSVIIIQREIMNLQAEELHVHQTALHAKDDVIEQHYETIAGMKMTMGLMSRKIHDQKEEMKGMEKKVKVAEESLLSKEIVLRSKDETIRELRKTVVDQRYNIESTQRLINMEGIRCKY